MLNILIIRLILATQALPLHNSWHGPLTKVGMGARHLASQQHVRVCTARPKQHEGLAYLTTTLLPVPMHLCMYPAYRGRYTRRGKGPGPKGCTHQNTG